MAKRRRGMDSRAPSGVASQMKVQVYLTAAAINLKPLATSRVRSPAVTGTTRLRDSCSAATRSRAVPVFDPFCVGTE
jgi:hypothetical protein